MTMSQSAGTTEVLHYTAFSTSPSGGNGAGVVLDAAALDDADMVAIAAELGYSESAFVTPGPDPEDARSFTLRFFSPKAEVGFCGHATVATAVALGERLGTGDFDFHTSAGHVPVTVREQDGVLKATLTSVAPRVEDADPADVTEALAALGWQAEELDAALPPRIAFAGVRHLVLAAGTRERLARLDYDFDRLLRLMERLDLTTVQLVWREGPAVFHVRDPFPVGGVVEDAATGAAAAAFGAYARALGLVPDDARLTLHQGHDMGRPSLLEVDLRPGDPRVRVTGAAIAV
ncbi:PhzF family phenazine biosynthesis protein OS=Streptomyces rochei OX=1928 GN=G3I25_14540 PE=3 SV=1 [Streptomyces rochei]|uniref:PhzF family phenazine biosynthesis protein n=1 Tax=Streptomyces TaxID=1883 RepID=UPI0004CC0CA2|nr:MULTISPECIES: PhzF family phenazine biosynthesis isomerase [Streptomyces]MBX4177748.1 PhzF family phenazine biosynthesis protein [Streptomyces geysiriensis]QCB26414.1 PhzF family phenazine biosynthesis isomerase [Streptomyces sp. SS52]RSS30772.1 PhzF family phenazine biosynthesis isomerase [Streptomyces sp. WAC08452]RSS92284.1 PhzF family phenazine biosynthesis isomerase [Streptomyces sp. WAC02707]